MTVWRWCYIVRAKSKDELIVIIISIAAFLCFHGLFVCFHIYPFLSHFSYFMLYIFVVFFLSFVLLISGSPHSSSPLARSVRYCLSTDSAKMYNIPQTSRSGPDPDPEPEPEQGPSSEACGQTRAQSGCKLPVGMKTTDGDDEGPPNISECGWVHRECDV